MYQIKPISKGGQAGALERAERYRLLNEPLEAESICLDVLQIEPENSEALIMLILALTDQFQTRLVEAARKARELLPRLADEYSRAYYEGVICERQAKALLERGSPNSGHLAYDWFTKALECYDRAEKLGPAWNDEAILRWNTCVRIMARNPGICARESDTVPELLE